MQGGGSLPDEGRRVARNSPLKLRGTRDVQRILRWGSAARSKRVVVYLARGSGPPRAAWVAGRKVGGAVARNRARRLLREAWRELFPRVGEGWQAVLVAREAISGAHAQEIVEEVGELLRRAGVLSA
ncbi:MAG TPA: ribonuclease P protein component [Actinomycetota bacterium]|nr:ribonuclease P protein component [Actinomycetota bacterium]